jgi:hypothetical protein
VFGPCCGSESAAPKQGTEEILHYYHQSRTHLALQKDAPEPWKIMSHGKIAAIPQVDGLHHRYERRTAFDEIVVMLNRLTLVVKPKQPDSRRLLAN